MQYVLEVGFKESSTVEDFGPFYFESTERVVERLVGREDVRSIKVRKATPDEEEE